MSLLDTHLRPSRLKTWNEVDRREITKICEDTALSGVMRYTTGGQDAQPTRVLLLKFVPPSNEICCK
ncbi:MAG: hypothetical protein ACKPB9_02325 [Dolichospermum sp.]